MPKVLIAAGTLVAVVGAGTGIAIASTTDEDDHQDRAISGDALAKASAAALAHTGDGRVTGTEVGDEESYYEVEVTWPDGRQLDVQLDEQFAVVGAKVDREDGN